MAQRRKCGRARWVIESGGGALDDYSRLHFLCCLLPVSGGRAVEKVARQHGKQSFGALSRVFRGLG